MLPDLERLIQLQKIETRAADARKRAADAPERIATLDAKLTASRDAVAAASQALADSQSARRTIEKDLLALQQRLAKSKETLMEVKTNHEYHAMQTQIAAGVADVARVEEQMLVNMLEADEISARLKKAESALKAEETAIAAERKSIEAEARETEKVLAATAEEKAALVPLIARNHLEMFERVLKGRHGVAISEAVDGLCSVCRVRLRPQVYNTIRRNDSIYQCDHCQRVMYFTGVHERSEAGKAAANKPSSQHGDPDLH